MSYTEIYAVSNGQSSPFQTAEIRNAHRGAMYVWNQIARDYFDLEMFPYSDEEKQKEVWNAGQHKPLSDAEKTVLVSTMDRASVLSKDLPKLIEAFREYGSAHPNSSYLEQAGVLKAFSQSIKEDQRIVWNQTSVNADLLFCDVDHDEDDEEILTVNLDEHWNVFEQAA